MRHLGCVRRRPASAKSPVPSHGVTKAQHCRYACGNLCGRDNELTVLGDLLGRTGDCHGGALVLLGDAGLGKTALLAAVRAMPGFRRIECAGVPAEKALPYGALRRLLDAVTSRVEQLPSVLARIATCDVSNKAREITGESAFFVGAELVSVLAEVARDQPMALCVDDAQWLDPESSTALLFAARRFQGHPIALLLATRSPVANDLPTLRLAPLTTAASRAVLAQRVPGGLSDDLADALVALASGNPLALVELADALTAEQRAGTAPAPVVLPENSRMRALYRRRLARLSAHAQHLVRIAVADREIELTTLIRAAKEAGIALPALAEATRSGLLTDHGDVIAAPSELVRTCLYADTPAADRQATHELLARVLDADPHRLRALVHRAAIAGRRDLRLAAELDRAGADERRSRDHVCAARAYELAARLTPDSDAKALRLLSAAREHWLAGATGRCRALLRRIRPLTADLTVRGLADLLRGELELRDGAPAAAQQSLLDAAAALTGTNRELAVTALMRAGEAGWAAGDYRGFLDIARLAATVNDSPRTPMLRMMADHFDGISATFRGDHERASAPLRRVISLGGKLPGCTAKGLASVSALVAGEDERAQDLAAQAVNAALADGSTTLTPWTLEVLAIASLRLDRHGVAFSAAAEGLRFAQAAGQRNSVVNHVALQGVVAALQGDKQTTVRCLETVTAAIARAPGQQRTMALWAQACLDLIEDRPADALAQLRVVIASPMRTMAMAQFVEAAARCDEHEAAAREVDDFDRWARATGNRAQLAISRRCQALLAGDDAAEHFDAALGLHGEADRPFEHAKTELFYGEWLRRARKPVAARKHLRQAWHTFRRYNTPYWTGRARAELRAAGEAVEAGTSATIADLTPQQAQISRLVAEGATNKEIAAQLFLSPRTVDHHLRNIFAKLGIRSRVELTAILR
ncbi:MAG TPA: LuxR C-terminal-related transcriptional regulator [Amycolatopsis sp.]|nr:LuxR C-terminal-related transcriptional regulator [Amycolatopsis sp.]